MIKFNFGGEMQLQDVQYSADNHQWNITMTANEWPWMMKQAKPSVRCPDCKTSNVVRHGTTSKLKQRYRCLNIDCERHNFAL